MHSRKYQADTLLGMVLLGRLRHYREQAALTQEELADRAGVTRLTVMRLEQGLQEPQAKTTRALARALKVKPSELMTAAVVDHNG